MSTTRLVHNPVYNPWNKLGTTTATTSEKYVPNPLLPLPIAGISMSVWKIAVMNFHVLLLGGYGYGKKERY